MSAIAMVLAVVSGSFTGTNNADPELIAAAQSFASCLGIDAGQVRQIGPGPDNNSGNVEIVFDKCTVLVEKCTKTALELENRVARAMAWPASKRTGKAFFRDEADLLAHSQKLLAGLKLTKNVRMSYMRLSSDRIPYEQPSDRGTAVTRFAQTESGFEYLSFNGVQFEFDSQDGQLLQARQCWKYRAVSFDLRLTEDDAKAQAVEYYKQFGKVTSAPPIVLVRLGFIAPNGEFGTRNSQEQPPHDARLGYSVVFGKGDGICIDAGDGRILGGAIWFKK